MQRVDAGSWYQADVGKVAATFVKMIDVQEHTRIGIIRSCSDIEHLGKRGDPASVRTIDVLISKLRKKIERDGNDIIKTVRGAGYVFTPLVTR